MRSEGDTEMAQPITVLGVKIWPSTLREAIVSFDPPLDPQPMDWVCKGDIPEEQRECLFSKPMLDVSTCTCSRR